MHSNKKRTTEEFVQEARLVHGDKYDYSKVVYVNRTTKVCIICPLHGEFWQIPADHLNGHGCNKCGICSRAKIAILKPRPKMRKFVCGLGINDYPFNTRHLLSYRKWCSIFTRCYDTSYLSKEPTYKDCSVCEEWRRFSVFKEWFDKNYIDGYCLDKDILVKGNKVYSPQTCCFVPNEINALLIKHDVKRGKCLIGVSKRGKKYYVQLSKYKTGRVWGGTYTTIKDAFNAYKEAKEKYIQQQAQSYFDRGLITEQVYNALMNYKVEITD